MKITSNGKALRRVIILASRQELSNMVYMCLAMLRDPALKAQETAVLKLSCVNQRDYDLPDDPAKKEARVFIDDLSSMNGMAIQQRLCKHCAGVYVGTAYGLCDKCGKFQ